MPSIEQARELYPAGDPVHGFDHVLRVYRLSDYIARAESADLEIVHAAALLHDADVPDGSSRSSHQHASAEFAAQILTDEGWLPERIAAVQHAIRSHRFRMVSEPPSTLEAKVLYDADKLDAIGLTGAARAIAYAARQGQPAYAPPSRTFLSEHRLEPGEAYSAYHEFCFKLVRIQGRLHTATAHRLAGERHARMVTFFEELARESQPFQP